MAKRRLTKEELEQDPLIQSYQKVEGLYYKHKSAIISAAVALLLIAGGGIGYYYYTQSQEQRAQQLMGYAEDYFLQGDYQSALVGSATDFTVGFEQIINNYDNTNAGNLARYYAAVSEFNLGNTETALSHMESYDIPDGILGVAPLSFRGVILTELGRHQEAAESYVEAAEQDVNDSTTPYNYLEAAYAYREAGFIELARQYADEIVNEFPNSTQAAEAERLLGLIAGNRAPD